MEPGLAILSLVLGLAALAPLIAAIAVGGLFCTSTRAQARRALLCGMFGGAVMLAGLLVLIALLTGQPFGRGIELVAMYGAGFTVCAAAPAARVAAAAARCRHAWRKKTT